MSCEKKKQKNGTTGVPWDVASGYQPFNSGRTSSSPATAGAGAPGRNHPGDPRTDRPFAFRRPPSRPRPRTPPRPKQKVGPSRAQQSPCLCRRVRKFLPRSLILKKYNEIIYHHNIMKYNAFWCRADRYREREIYCVGGSWGWLPGWLGGSKLLSEAIAPIKKLMP